MIGLGSGGHQTGPIRGRTFAGTFLKKGALLSPGSVSKQDLRPERLAAAKRREPAIEGNQHSEEQSQNMENENGPNRPQDSAGPEPAPPLDFPMTNANTSPLQYSLRWVLSRAAKESYVTY